jgi:AcrR family transcriptional regulator
MGDGAAGFSIDAVAERAGVSRMTVYNQFDSKAGLLEALFDCLAIRGPLGGLADVFETPDPVDALDEFVAIFGRFWTASRKAHGRLRAAALNDEELAAAMLRRNERRRAGITELLRRLGDRATPIIPKGEVVNVLYVMLAFETFDAIAGAERTPNDVVPIVRRMVRAVLGIESARRPRKKRAAP